MKSISQIIACGVALLSVVSCTQVGQPVNLKGDRSKTLNMSVDHAGCQVVAGRIHGESTGTKLLWIIPLTSASEATAIDNMYAKARSCGAQPEGSARQFVNTSIEKTTDIGFLYTRETIRSTGDLVQFTASGR